MTVLWSGEGKSLVAQASQGVLGAKKYTITDEYIYSEVGSLSSKGEQVPMWAIRDVDFRQSIMQKARGVASITVRTEHNDYTGTAQLVLEDIAAGIELRDLINSTAQTARLAYQRLAQTQHMSYQGSPAMPVIQVASGVGDSASTAETSLLGQIEKLGEMKDKGLISSEEFAALKAQIIAGK